MASHSTRKHAELHDACMWQHAAKVRCDVHPCMRCNPVRHAMCRWKSPLAHIRPATYSTQSMSQRNAPHTHTMHAVCESTIHQRQVEDLPLCATRPMRFISGLVTACTQHRSHNNTTCDRWENTGQRESSRGVEEKKGQGQGDGAMVSTHNMYIALMGCNISLHQITCAATERDRNDVWGGEAVLGTDRIQTYVADASMLLCCDVVVHSFMMIETRYACRQAWYRTDIRMWRVMRWMQV